MSGEPAAVVMAVPIRVPAADAAAIDVVAGSTWPAAAVWTPPAAVIADAATSRWMQPSSGHTVTCAPDAASCAATPHATVDAAPAWATVPLPDTARTLPPTTAPEVVAV